MADHIVADSDLFIYYIQACLALSAADIENGNANVLIVLDGSDSFSVGSGYSAASIVTQNYSIRLTAEKIERAGAVSGSLQQAVNMPITSSIQVLYNPDLRDLWFILPAITVLLES